MKRALFILLLAVLSDGRAEQIRPADGFWWSPDLSGSGLTMSFQDDVMVIAIYSYRADATGVWLLASGPITDGVFEADLNEFTAGSCFGCEYQAPTQLTPPRNLRITFSSVRHAMMTIDSDEPIAIQSFIFNFGDGLVHTDPDFGRSFLPLLRGRWVFTSEDSDGDFLRSLDFLGVVIIDPPGFGFGDIGYFLDNPEAEAGIPGAEVLAFTCFSNGSSPDAWPEPVVVPVCILVDAQSRGMDPPLFSVYVPDIGYNRIVAYEGPPVTVASGKVRGDNLIIGFKVLTHHQLNATFPKQ